MTRNNGKIKNEEKIAKSVSNIENILIQQNKKHSIFNINFFAIIISIATLIISVIALITSYKLSTNNSALNFIYENIDIVGIDEGKKIRKITIKGSDLLSAPTLGNAEIHINTRVISGQINSLYLIQKRNDKFIFYLLNDSVQDKFSFLKKYNTEIFFEMKKLTEYEENNGHKKLPIGMSQMYILSEDLNEKINIDVIQVIGPITTDINNKKITIYGPSSGFAFRYLKNNKLITYYNNDINEGWINLSDKYSDITPKADIKKIEEDITMIKEIYSKF